MKLLTSSCVLLAAISAAHPTAASGLLWALEFEAAMVSAARNDVSIPAGAGTRFSLVDDLQTDEDVAFRLRLGRRIGDRHHVSALYAPLRLHAAGRPGFDVAFNGQDFDADADLGAVYRFNSYRLTWRYDAVRDERLELGIGLTGKIRHAFIELNDVRTTTRKDDLGFVPLLHLRLDWRWTGKLGLLLESDALAAPQGRAVDALLAITVQPWHQGVFRLGYRMLEGGADGEEVYNFALIHYFVIGWTQRF